MDDREKLIELLALLCREDGLGNDCPTCCKAYCDEFRDSCYGGVADHLIANGVVIQKQGKWEESLCYDQCFWVCSVCRFPSEASVAPKLYRFCPNCGAKMKEVK